MGRFARTARSALHSRHAAKVLWFSLLAVHIPAVVAIARSLAQGESSISIWSLLGLAATIAFFTLKCLDVPFLRFKGHGTKIAFLLACAIVHRGVVTGPLVVQVIDDAPLIAAVAGAASLFTSSRLRRRFRNIIRTIQRSMQRAPRLFPTAALDIARHTMPKIDVPMHRLRQPSRGPPAFAL